MLNKNGASLIPAENDKDLEDRNHTRLIEIAPSDGILIRYILVVRQVLYQWHIVDEFSSQPTVADRKKSTSRKS